MWCLLIKEWFLRVTDRDESPPARLGVPIAIFFVILAISMGLWVRLIPYINMDNAKWTLSAQVQVSATLLGLLIAAGAFRWRTVTNQEKQIQTQTDLYLKMAAKPLTKHQGQASVSQIACSEYLSLITKDTSEGRKPKMPKNTCKILGHLWVIRQLSSLFEPSTNVKLVRLLKKSQTKDLSQISKLSKKYALEMREKYFIDQAAFFLEFSDTFRNFHNKVVMPRLVEKETGIKKPNGEEDKYMILDNFVQALTSDDIRLTAYRVQIWRGHFKSRFYWVCSFLSCAVVIGLLFLSGLHGGMVSPILGVCSIQLAVILPVALTILGLFFAILTVLLIFR